MKLEEIQGWLGLAGTAIGASILFLRKLLQPWAERRAANRQAEEQERRNANAQAWTTLQNQVGTLEQRLAENEELNRQLYERLISTTERLSRANQLAATLTEHLQTTKSEPQSTIRGTEKNPASTTSNDLSTPLPNRVRRT